MLKTIATPPELNKQRETAELQWLKIRAEAEYDTACELTQNQSESYSIFHTEKTGDLSCLLFKKNDKQQKPAGGTTPS